MVRVRAAALLAILALLFVACQPAGQTTAPSTPGQTGAETPSEPAGESPTDAASPTDGGPTEGGTLVVALPGDIDNLDPALISDSNSSYVMNQVMEGLVQLAPGSVSELSPTLAAELPEVSDDGLTYTFTLREGVKFHDGTDFDAEAVKFNFDRWLNFPEDLQVFAYYAGAVFEGFGDGSNIASTEASDATTFVVTLKEPRSNFLIALTLAPFFISSPTALEEGDADNPDPSQSRYAQETGMVGTGPFKFDSWTPDTEVRVVKNEEYSGGQEPALLDEIIFRPFADQTAEFNALQAGEVDFAQTIAPIDAESIASDPNLQVIDRGESCNMGHLAMNHNHPPLDNPDIRRAIAHALNKESYIETFYAGQAVPADNWMPPATLYYKELGLPTYDTAEAERLIAESGVTDLTIDFWYPSDVARPYMPDPKGLFEAIQSDLEAVGFTINPNTATWSPDYLDAESAGQYPMWLIGWTCDWASADNFLSTAFFAYRDGEPNPEYAYDNDELDRIMGEALSSTDEAEAEDLWHQAQDLVAADIPTVPLIHSTPPAAAAAKVQGVQGSGALNEYFNTVYIQE